jgi:hypothetical protein
VSAMPGGQDAVVVGSVLDAAGEKVDVLLGRDGAVALESRVAFIGFPSGWLAALQGLLDRAAMPGRRGSDGGKRPAAGAPRAASADPDADGVGGPACDAWTEVECDADVDASCGSRLVCRLEQGHGGDLHHDPRGLWWSTADDLLGRSR